jgi:hypothetical protein
LLTLVGPLSFDTAFSGFLLCSLWSNLKGYLRIIGRIPTKEPTGGNQGIDVEGFRGKDIERREGNEEAINDRDLRYGAISRDKPRERPGLRFREGCRGLSDWQIEGFRAGGWSTQTKDFSRELLKEGIRATGRRMEWRKTSAGKIREETTSEMFAEEGDMILGVETTGNWGGSKEASKEPLKGSTNIGRDPTRNAGWCQPRIRRSDRETTHEGINRDIEVRRVVSVVGEER